MKLKFVAYWDSDHNIYQFINDIWNLNGEFDQNITFKDDYDYLIILNKVDNTKYRIEKERTYGIVIEPYWSTSFDKNILDYAKKIITYQPDKYLENRTIHSPLIGTHRLYESNGEIIPVEGTTKKILEYTHIKEKKLSIILSNHTDAYNHQSSEAIYHKRQDLLKKLLESDLDFDFFGKGWSFNDVRYKGTLSNKIHGLQKYEYSICLENSHVGGEITEKIIDAILCNTIPIYNGNPSVFDFYGNCCEYLEYDGNEISRIKDILNSGKSYKDYELDKAKDLYLNKYNPIKIILKDIKEDIEFN